MHNEGGQVSHDNEKAVSAIDAAGRGIDSDLPDQVIARRFGVFGPLVFKLFQSGVEARGVERIPEYQRESKYLWNNLLMWCQVGQHGAHHDPCGYIGSIRFQPLSSGSHPLVPYQACFSHTLATIICFGALGSIATAFGATLGPQTGLRTMIIARYSSGYLGGIFFSVLNILTQFGYSATTVIVGGQTLSSINPEALSLVGGIIVISVLSFIPCFVGYDMVHLYERYAWVVMFFIVCCLYGLGSKVGYDVNTQKALEGSGRVLSADILGFGTVVFGTACWVNVAADYTVRLPVDTNPWHVFMLTFWGVYLATVFSVSLGATLMTITDPAYVAASNSSGGTGALNAQVLSPWRGGGKFLLVMLSLSAVSTNIIDTYSAALSIQALGRPFAMVPRFLWVLFVVVVYTVAGVAGREHFSAILSNVLSILGYWTGIFVVLVAEEHFRFRRKGGRLGGYNLADWDKPSKLPMGIAGILACMFGIVGAVVGMSQEWYTGPIGRMAGASESGADLGLELAVGFTAVTFPPLRWLEIRFTGR